MTGRAPAVPLALSFFAGLCLPLPWPMAWPSGPHVTLALAATLVAATLACALRGRLVLGTTLALASYTVLGAAAREARGDARDRSSVRRLYETLGEGQFLTPRQITGRLRSEPELGPDAAVLVLDVEEARVRRERFSVDGGVRLTVRGRRREALADLSTGDRMRLWARLRSPSGPRNPGGLDADRYFARQRIVLLGTVKSALLIERLHAAGRLRSSLSRLRRRALTSLERALGTRGPTLGVVAALVTGDRSRLTSRLERRFQRAGVFHVMAISGAHVAILTLLVYGALRRSGLDEAPALVLLLILLPLYAGFCGGRAPVVRAVMMAAVVLAARLLSLDRPRANALALGALGLAAWNPEWVTDAGFQLTFAAMASILLLFDTVGMALAPLGRLGPPLALSLSAQAGVVPVTAWHFLRVAPAAPVASLLAIPLAGLVLVLGLLLVGVAELPLPVAATRLVATAAELAVAVLVALAELFARLPFASLDTKQPALGWMVAYFVALVACRSPSPRSKGLALASVLFLVALLLPGTPNRSDELRVTAIDVGHGDALVLRLPGGENVLVDGGGTPGSSFDVGASVVLPYLRATGVRRLDAVLVSHTDFDHLGGLLTVVEELPVGEIWEGVPRFDRLAYRILRDRAVARSIRVRRLRAGERFYFGRVRWEVLAAGGLAGIVPRETNDESVVVRLVYGRSRVLLTGDAERALEEALVREPMRIAADVLKVAHHGSESSSSPAFLEAVGARLAIVSGRRTVGRPIPSTRVLERLHRYGIEILRTDESGAVTVRARANGEIRASTFLAEP